MLQEVIKLEILRQKIENEERVREGAGEYDVDGRPNPQLSKAARAEIGASRSRSAELQTQLRDRIVSIRQANLSALEEWVSLHKGLLSPILEEKAKDGIGDTRITMAKWTLQKWEKVLSGEQDYVSINRHFLKDYYQEIRNQLTQNSR